MLNFNEIKGALQDAEMEEAKKVAERQKRMDDYLNYTASIIEGRMSLDASNKSVFAYIPREDVPVEYWDRFESNGILINTRLPGVLSRKMNGAKVKFNTLDYGKRESKEGPYIFFAFTVELD